MEVIKKFILQFVKDIKKYIYENAKTDIFGHWLFRKSKRKFHGGLNLSLLFFYWAHFISNKTDHECLSSVATSKS